MQTLNSTWRPQKRTILRVLRRTLEFCRQNVGRIRIFEHNYSTSLCHPSCWWRKTARCPWKHSWEQQQNKRREVGGYVKLSFFFSYSIFQDNFSWDRKHSSDTQTLPIFRIFITVLWLTYGLEGRTNQRLWWGLKKICFVYFSESQARQKPTTETTRLSKRLVFYFLRRWHERLCLWALTLHLQRPSTHTCSNSMRLSKKDAGVT